MVRADRTGAEADASGAAGTRAATGAAATGAGFGRVVLVRHGETDWSRALRHTGRTDVPLDPAGEQEARALAPTLAAWSFAQVLTSPLRRAADTCRLAGLGSQAEVCPDLVEWDYGEYEGRTTEEIRCERPGWWLWRDGVPGGESLGQLAERADRVVAGLRASAGDVAVFAHGHVLRVLAARWVGLEPAAGAVLVLGAGRLGQLGWEHEEPAIVEWNVPARAAASGRD